MRRNIWEHWYYIVLGHLIDSLFISHHTIALLVEKYKINANNKPKFPSLTYSVPFECWEIVLTSDKFFCHFALFFIFDPTFKSSFILLCSFVWLKPFNAFQWNQQFGSASKYRCRHLEMNLQLFFIIGIIENEILVKLENGIKTGIQCYINFAASVAISFTCLSNSSAPNYFNQSSSWSRNIHSKLNSKFRNRTEHDSPKKKRWKKPTELVKNYFKN